MFFLRGPHPDERYTIRSTLLRPLGCMRHPPPDDLRPFVREVVIYDAQSDPARTIVKDSTRLFECPGISAGITSVQLCPVGCEEKEGAHVWETGIIGPHAALRPLLPPGLVILRLIAVVAWPAASSWVTGVIGGETAGQIYPAEQILQLPASLSECLAPAQQLSELFAVVRRRTSKLKTDPCNPVDYEVVRWLEHHGQPSDMDGLVRHLGWSARHIRRRFHTATGWSMKSYACMQRLTRTIEDAILRRQINWTALASRHGYADQAHLSRECRRFLGLSPRQLFRQESNRRYLAACCVQLPGFQCEPRTPDRPSRLEAKI